MVYTIYTIIKTATKSISIPLNPINMMVKNAKDANILNARPPRKFMENVLGSFENALRKTKCVDTVIKK